MSLSACTSNLNELRTQLAAAYNLRAFGRQTTVFIDEIHRFSKLQQDALLPAVENGTIHLIAATTENPSFYCNNALLSRCRVIQLHKLSVDNVVAIVKRAEASMPRAAAVAPLSEGLLVKIADAADGDGRAALNLLELAHQLRESMPHESEEGISQKLNRSHVTFDRDGDEHYGVISALHKSMRGNDPNAAIYWLARQLGGGEDPRFIARRLVVFASEDVGLANPQALSLAVSTFHACTMIGLPECEINLAHCVTYLASCAKSTTAYMALKRAKEAVQGHPNLPPPKHIINAPTKMMKQLGYADGYLYNPEIPDVEGKIIQQYLPDAVADLRFFQPTPQDELDIRALPFQQSNGSS